jgi:outer membrane immunogenic protein
MGYARRWGVTMNYNKASVRTWLLALATCAAGLILDGPTETWAQPVSPAPTYSWTGVYVGANAGYGWGNASGDTVSGDPASALFLSQTFSSSFASSFRQSGGFVGAQAGYNWQFSGNWVGGFEADLQAAHIAGSNSNVVFLNPGSFGTSFPFDLNAERNLEWFGTVRGRLGVLATPNLLVYGTAGLAYGKTETSGSVVLANGTVAYTAGGFGFKCSGPATCYAGSGSQTSTGWAAGAGFEDRLSRNLTAKLEYLHVDLGGQTLTLNSPLPSTSGVSVGHVFNREQVDIIRFGLNYQFGGSTVVDNTGGPAPAPAAAGSGGNRRGPPKTKTAALPAGDEGLPILISYRIPADQEKWLVFEEDGTIRMIEGIWNLYVYYHQKSLPWPYITRKGPYMPDHPAGKNPDPSTYSINEVAPTIGPEKAPELGMSTDHATKWAAWAKDNQELDIIRASNPASLQHQNDPNAMAKPAEIYVKEDGTWTDDKRQSYHGIKRSLTDVHTNPKTGWVEWKKPLPHSKRTQSEPIVIDGKRVFADTDVQAAFKKGQNGKYGPVLTDRSGWIERINAHLGSVQVRHAVEATYKGLP